MRGLLLAALLGLAGCREPATQNAPDHGAERDGLYETGTIIAAHSVEVLSPNWGGSHYINFMAPEGMHVSAGDTVLVFDPTEIRDRYLQYEAELEVLRKAVGGARAQETANRTRTGNAIAKARLAFERAELELENRRFESLSVRQNAELDGRLARVALDEALRDSVAQARMDSLEVANKELKAAKQAARVRRFKTYLDELTKTAPAAGMVVYQRSYTDEGVKSFRAGDEVGSRTAVLDVTDTSVMKVRFTIHEQDRWRVAAGQEVGIVLDAFRDTEFPGVIENVERLPEESVPGRLARRFEAVARVQSTDSRLKPGMSARVIIPTGGTR